MSQKQGRQSEEELWAGESGERWLKNAARMEAMLEGIGEELMQRAQLVPGERVLEVGCGAGGLALRMAQRVMPGGNVTALDISPALVREGTRRAAAAGIADHTQFTLGNAATVEAADKVDCLVSRFGVMFFADPYAAFAHLRRQVRPGGRLTMACWRAAQENAWMWEMRQIVGKHVTLPAPVPRAAGPCAFEDPAYLREVLEKAGFGEVEIQPWNTEMPIGGTGNYAETAADFLLGAMGVGQKAMEAPEEIRTRVRTEVVACMKRYETTNGVKMPAAIWFTRGRA